MIQAEIWNGDISLLSEYHLCSGRMLILPKLHMCYQPVNHSSWDEESFSQVFTVHELHVEGDLVVVYGEWGRISLMLSARFVPSARTQKSVPKQHKGLQAAGGSMWCGGGPSSAEVISGAVEATGSAKGALGPAQAPSPGRQPSLPPQSVLEALPVSVAWAKFMWGSGAWALAGYCPCSEGGIWPLSLVCLAPLIAKETRQCVSTNSAFQEKLSSVGCRHRTGFHWATLNVIYPEFWPWKRVLLKCPFGTD